MQHAEHLRGNQEHPIDGDGSGRLEGHWKSFRSEHDATVNDFKWLIVEQVQSWQSLQYLPQSDLHLKARQWGANTEVDTMAKGQVTVRVALDIKLLRVRKLAFIEVV